MADVTTDFTGECLLLFEVDSDKGKTVQVNSFRELSTLVGVVPSGFAVKFIPLDTDVALDVVQDVSPDLIKE